MEIITPSLNIPKGTVLGTQNLSKREILADLVTEEMVLVSDFGRVDGIRATRSLQAGLPLRFSDVMEKSKLFQSPLKQGEEPSPLKSMKSTPWRKWSNQATLLI